MANSKNNKQNESNAELNENKTAASKKPENSGKKSGGLLAFLRGVRQELKKVVWPTREELTTDTIVVIVCVVFFALAFWLIDTGFLAALKGILGITLS